MMSTVFRTAAIIILALSLSSLVDAKPGGRGGGGGGGGGHTAGNSGGHHPADHASAATTAGRMSVADRAAACGWRYRTAAHAPACDMPCRAAHDSMVRRVRVLPTNIGSRRESHRRPAFTHRGPRGAVAARPSSRSGLERRALRRDLVRDLGRHSLSRRAAREAPLRSVPAHARAEARG